MTVECVEIEQLTHDLEDPKHVKQALKKIGAEYFKSILTKDSKRTSIRENIKKADYKITGSGRGWSLIHTLAESGRELAIQLLLEKGGDKEAASMDGTPLVIATAHNNPGTVKLLLKRNANTEAMNEDGSTALNIAAIYGYEQCVQLLLNSGANPQWKPAVKKWNTPLIDAAMRGYESIVQLLLDKDADMEAESNIGSALVEATLGESEGIVRLLLNKGANPNARARNMGTALNIAANNGYKGIVELLLGRGAHLEATDKNRKTPLMLAAEREDVEVVRLLLNSGARLDAKDINGLSALQCANRKPASRATSAMSDLHDTPTIRLLLSEIRSRMQRERRRISSRSTLGVN
jgi:ankyrin repeat protein